MNSLSYTLCCISLLVSFPLPAQEGKVEVVNAGSKELKRSAYHLHMTAERLKNARRALQEATDLARRVRPVPIQYFFQLGDSWVQLNRSKAEGSITSLLSTLRSAAQGASDPAMYSDATGAAQVLIASLAQIDAEQSLEWAREWPAPSPSLGIETQAHAGNMERQLRRSALQRLAVSDPDAALKLLSAGPDPAAEDYYVRGPLAAQLMRTGRTEEAGKLVDRTLAEFAAAKPDPAAWSSYANFLASVPQVAPERFLEAFQLWAKNPPPQLQGTRGSPLPIGNGPVLLDANEAAAMNILRSLRSRPELMMKALDSMPSLKGKLDQAGGIDAALNGGRGMPQAAVAFYRNPDGSVRPIRPDASNPPPTQLLAELRGKAIKNPQLVRSRLAAMVTKPEDVGQVLQLAMMSVWQDADLGCLAVEVARPIVLRIDPPERQLGLFQQLVQATRECEGEIDSALIKEGFILADELRQNEKERAGPQTQPAHSPADQLETMLLSELARDDFNAAIRYVRTMGEDPRKLAALVAIIQSCRESY